MGKHPIPEPRPCQYSISRDTKTGETIISDEEDKVVSTDNYSTLIRNVREIFFDLRRRARVSWMFDFEASKENLIEGSVRRTARAIKDPHGPLLKHVQHFL